MGAATRACFSGKFQQFSLITAGDRLGIDCVHHQSFQRLGGFIEGDAGERVVRAHPVRTAECPSQSDETDPANLLKGLVGAHKGVHRKTLPGAELGEPFKLRDRLGTLLRASPVWVTPQRFEFLTINGFSS